MKRKWFGTDGIRGEFGKEPMTPHFAARLGIALVNYFGQEGRFVLARDTRASGPLLQVALCMGIESRAGVVERLGVLPTAAVSLYTKENHATAGIMISASHNPASDNGIKIFSSNGFKLSDSMELEIEAEIEKVKWDQPIMEPPMHEWDYSQRAAGVYFHALRRSLPIGFSLSGIKLSLDAAHGAAWKVAPAFLRSLGSELVEMGCEPNGTNINLQCGCLFPEGISALTTANSCQAGIALDGDADRILLVDEKGQTMDGDDILALLGVRALKRGELPHDTLVATSMSNLGLDEAIHTAGGKVLRTDVGDRYVLAAMKEHHLTLGGEQSGHLLLLEHLPTGDGLLAALQVLAIMVETGRPLSELRQVLVKYPQHHAALRVREKLPIEQVEGLLEAIQEVESAMAGKGRVVVRYSGTEPKIRLLLEGPDGTFLATAAARLSQIIQQRLGV